MRLVGLVVMSIVLGACAATGQGQAPAPAPAASPAPAPAPQAQTRKVEGIGGWSGEIKGTAIAGSPFNKLKIGMGPKEVHDLIGPPTDQGRHVTGKAWIPFYYGSGSVESIQHYKGVGRLIFANSSRFSGSMGLIQIDHDGAERGYR
jgi:hypothetical protein